MLAIPPRPPPNVFKRVWDAVVRPPAVRPFTEQGVSGTPIYGGTVQTREKSSKWIASQKYTTISDMAVNTSIIAAGVHYFLNLIAHPQWTIVPSDENSAEAKKAVELVENAIYGMEIPWSRVVRRAGTFRFYGYGLQEWTAKKNDDSTVGLLSIEPRPQHTIDQWVVADDGAVEGVWQVHPKTGERIGLPRKKLLYLVEDTLTDSPEGIGLFRHLAEPWERLKAYYDLETRAFERDLRGIPIGRVPYSQLNAMVDSGELTTTQRDAMVTAVEDFVKMEVKQSDTSITLDSLPYYSQAADGAKVAGTPQFGIELLQGSAAGVEAIAAAIIRTQTEMARILTVEHLMMGESSGNRALGEDKSKGLALIANSVLDDIADGVTSDVVKHICMLNGVAEEFYPHCEVEDVAFKDADKVAATLAKMAQAGAVLAPDDPVIEDVRSLMGVSAPTPIPPELLGMGTDDEEEDEDVELDPETGKPIAKFDPNQPRAENGKWTSGGGGAHAGEGYSTGAMVRDGVIHTSNVDDAVRALHEGKKVQLDQPEQVSTLVGELARISREAEAAGENAKNYDLCNVSVKGSNLFCADSKGIPRVQMPQLKGVPIPGSKAAALTPDSRGEVDLTDKFRERLAERGIGFKDEDVRADFLRATQNELNGAKVGGIAGAIREGKLDDARLFVSRDNYIADGHHRWAATVAVDFDDNRPGDLKMKVAKVDMGIIELLDKSRAFAAEWGIPQADVGAGFGKFDPNQPRADDGKWTTGGGGYPGLIMPKPPVPRNASGQTGARATRRFLQSSAAKTTIASAAGAFSIHSVIGTTEEMSGDIVAGAVTAGLAAVLPALSSGVTGAVLAAGAAYATAVVVRRLGWTPTNAKNALRAVANQLVGLRRGGVAKADDEVLDALEAFIAALDAYDESELVRMKKALDVAWAHFQKTGESTVVVGVEG